VPLAIVRGLKGFEVIDNRNRLCEPLLERETSSVHDWAAGSASYSGRVRIAISS